MRATRSFVFVCLVSQLAFALSACQTTKDKGDGIGPLPPRNGPNGGVVSPTGPLLDVKSPADGGAMTLAKPITSLGKNSEPRFSPDGSRVLFISRERFAHRQAQVYELDLGQMTERRVTFHDGDDSGPDYYPNGTEIVYASSTDESKEEPALSKHMMQTYLPESIDVAKKSENAASKADFGIAELYRQKLNGQDLERMTFAPGFDGDATVRQDRMIFSSARQGAMNLYLVANTPLGPAIGSLTEGPFRDERARFSPQGDALVWSRRSPDGKTAQIMIMIMNTVGELQPPRALTTGSLDLQPTWNPNGEEILFSSNRGSDSGTFNLFSIDRKGECLKKLTEVPGSLLHPAVSPDGKRLAFTLARESQSQIYMMDYRPGTNCLAP